MHAVIIAGGLGTRAHAMTGDRIPKALLPVGGVPIMFRQMRVLRREGVARLTVLAGHLGAQLAGPLGEEARNLGLALDIRVEPEPLGTAGCLAALAPADGDALLVYGDMLFDLALAPLARFHSEPGQRSSPSWRIPTIIRAPRTSSASATGWSPRCLPREIPRARDERNLVPAGLYLASADFFARIPRRKSSTWCATCCRAWSRRASGSRRTTRPNTCATSAPRSATPPPSATWRTGPLRRSTSRTSGRRSSSTSTACSTKSPACRASSRPDDVTLVPGAGAAVAEARNGRFLTVGITNRPQVARGDITFDDLDAILGRLEALLAEQQGVLDRIYVCPHHPDSGFAGEVKALKIRCECRKPGALLFRRAMAELPIDRARSIAIGDSLRDIGAARAAGVWAYGVRTGHGCRDAARYPGGAAAAPAPDLMFEDVGEAVRFGLAYRELAAPLVESGARPRG